MGISQINSLLMALLSIRGVGPVRLWELIESAAKGKPNFCEIECDELLAGLTPKEQAAFDDSLMHRRAAELEARDVHLISVLDADYPKQLTARLGRKSPPILSLIGSAEILGELGVGFCGSRKASDRGIEVAGDCAEQLAREGLSVISGYASGVDIAAHSASLEAGGHTVFCLAEGILRFRVKKSIERLWNSQQAVVVSEFLPTLPWSVHHAMQRNSTICALSSAMILIEAGERGGSIEAGRKSLELGVPLFAAVYDGMPDEATGNRTLLSVGAQPLMRSRSSGRAQLARVLDTIRRPEDATNEGPKGSTREPQRELF